MSGSANLRKMEYPVFDLTSDTDEESCEPSENDILKICIEEEAKLIIKIFPEFHLNTVRDMLTKLGNLPKRSKFVLRQLSKEHESKAPPCFLQRSKASTGQPLMKLPSGGTIVKRENIPQHPQSYNRKLTFPELFALLLAALPKADPVYLETRLVQLQNSPAELRTFVERALITHDYPKRNPADKENWEELLRSQMSNPRFAQLLNQIAPPSCDVFAGGFPGSGPISRSPRQVKKRKQSNMEDKPNLNDLLNPAREDFLLPRNGTPLYSTIWQNNPGVIPKAQESLLPKEDPALYTTKFSVQNFLESIQNPETYFRENRHTKPWSLQCEHYASFALFNIYNKIGFDEIKECISIAPNFLAACDMLDKVNQPNAKLRPDLPMPPLVDNIPLLKEIAYKTHYAEIMQFMKTRKEDYLLKITAAKATGSIYQCACCFNEEVLPEDVFKCENNCCFCKECIRTGVETSSSNGRDPFKCLNNCKAQFSLDTFQRALPEQLFLEMTRKKQEENMERCPFCNFSDVPKTGAQVFCCLNPDCTKESCRLCKAENHFPKTCGEMEQDENVMARTYIENKMTEAILRECYECKRKFVKSGGCNTISCPCGALMCYICRKPVTDLYLHRGCQKHSVAKIDEEMVMKAGQAAKKEVFTILKIDPTVGMKRYFECLRRLHLELKKEDEATGFGQGPPKRKKVENGIAFAAASSSHASGYLQMSTN